MSLQDCLSAFFSADELKEDNMYSCEKCKKLRNGIKYSKVIDLPEVSIADFNHIYLEVWVLNFIFKIENVKSKSKIYKSMKIDLIIWIFFVQFYILLALSYRAKYSIL